MLGGPDTPTNRSGRILMLVASPNLALDITVRVAALIPGSVSRATATDTVAGGKGANVSRAARALGGSPMLAGFLPVRDGDSFSRLAAAEGLPLLSVPVSGVLRLATAILSDDGQVTLINGRGPEIDSNSWGKYVAKIGAAAAGHRALVCSGSLPPGVPAAGYRELVELGHAAGLPVVVDAAPEVLAQSLPAGPDLVSPNLSEAEGLVLGRTDEQVDERGEDIPDRAVAAARELHALGAVRAVVTAGGSGAALATAAGSWWFPAVPVDVVNPIGAGDSFVAGATLALIAGAGDTEVVARGMAAASASCESPLAAVLDPARAAALFRRLAPVAR